MGIKCPIELFNAEYKYICKIHKMPVYCDKGFMNMGYYCGVSFW